MYSDIFDQLGASSAGATTTSRSTTTAEPEPLVSFRAGRIETTWNPEKQLYNCEPNTLRGQVRLVYTNNNLQWQWYNRRDSKVESSENITENSGKFQRIDLDDPNNASQRIYVWTKKPGDYELYWMQDKDFESEDDTIAKVNQYLADPSLAAPEGSVGAGAATLPSTSTAAAAAAATSTTNQAQVDALSSILENLGMPQEQAEGASAGAAAATAAAATTEGQRTLTQADLAAAMAGITQQAQPAGPSSLNDVVTPEAITSLLQHEAARERLLEFLPENQRNVEHLEANLRSPQVQQTLRSLTLALLPDRETGSLDGLASVLANFQLDDDEDDEDATTAAPISNPIQAFLDRILRKAEKDKDEPIEEADEELNEEAPREEDDTRE